MRIKRRLIGILIVALVFMGLATAGALPLDISVAGVRPADYDDNARGFDMGYTLIGSGAYIGSELLDSIRYVTGVIKSEKIVVEGAIFKGFAASCIKDSEYRFQFTSGNSWGPVDRTKWVGAFDLIVGGTANAGFRTLDSYPTAGGWVRAEFWVNIFDFCQTFNLDKGWHLAVRDDARIVNGAGEVAWNTGTAQVGQTVTATYSIGYAESSKIDNPLTGGWTLDIFSGARGSNVPGFSGKVLTGANPDSGPEIVPGSVDYTISEEDFALTDRCGVATSKNYLRVTIHNNLVSADTDSLTTVDKLALAPPAPIITLDKTQYEIGDSITISLVANPNTQTNLPICGIHLTIAYSDLAVDPLFDGDVGAFIGDELGLIAEKTYFALPDDGRLIITAWSYDAASRGSVPSEASVMVIDPTAEEEGIPIFILVVIMVSLIVVAIILLLPIPGISSIPLPVRGLVSTILIGISVGMFVLFFVAPAVCQFLENVFFFLGFEC